MCEAQQHQHHVRSGQHAKWWNRKVGREPEQTKISPSQAVIDKARQVAVDQSEMAVHPPLLLLSLTVLSIRKVTCHAGLAKEPGRRSPYRKLDSKEHVFGQMSRR